MTTKPIGIRNLIRGDKVKTPVRYTDPETEETTDTTELLTYRGMYGEFAKLVGDDGTILNATWYVKKVKSHYERAAKPKN